MRDATWYAPLGHYLLAGIQNLADGPESFPPANERKSAIGQGPRDNGLPTVEAFLWTFVRTDSVRRRAECSQRSGRGRTGRLVVLETHSQNAPSAGATDAGCKLGADADRSLHPGQATRERTASLASCRPA